MMDLLLLASSSSPPFSKPTPHMLAFLSVLAISGSVAILSLTKDKLWSYVFPDDLTILHTLTNHTSRGSHRQKPRQKKVRFAPDVVDPSSDGKEYRRKCEQIAAMKMNEQLSSSISQVEQGDDGVSRNPEVERRRRSSIPSNRMALYKDRQRSRRQGAV